MLLLQKQTGIEWMRQAYNNNPSSNREWFKGQFRYSTKEKIVNRFMEGESLSCFLSQQCATEIHIAFYGGQSDVISYLTLEYDTSDGSFVQDVGVHYCNFSIKKEVGSNDALVTTDKKEIVQNMMDYYALLLPYKKENLQDNTFTLIYHDWDVLVCDDKDNVKGLPRPDVGVFSKDYIKFLECQ